jgi:uncharacterized protein YijF (DUF1287 family)
MKKTLLLLGLTLILGFFSWKEITDQKNVQTTQIKHVEKPEIASNGLEEDSIIDNPNLFKFVEHVRWQSTQDVTYDPSYFTLNYPNGDVPANKGVCVDVPIRGLRTIGIDLQKLVHEDVLANANAYRITRADRNIDHRRCVNLITYFKREKVTVLVTNNAADYRPGDIVFWDIARGHVGVVTNVKVPGTDRYFMVHNICCGPQMEDFLFAAPIVCHVSFDKVTSELK